MALRSFSTRLFVAVLTVSLAAFGLGGWWLSRAVHVEVAQFVTVDRTIQNGEERINRTVRMNEPPMGEPGGGAAEAPPPGGGFEATLSRRLLVALGIILAGTVGATALVARRLLGPLRDLRRAAGQWSSGSLTTRVDVRGTDEVADVARALNDMAAALEVQERQKRDLTNDVAHELRTPLTNLRCHLEALQDKLVSATPDTLSTLLVEVTHLERLVEDLGDLARAESGQLTLHPAAVSLVEVVGHLARELAQRLATSAIALDVDVSTDLPAIAADRERLVQVLRNLIDNAIAHTPGGGRIRVSAAAGDAHVTIRVSDTGSGIAAAHLPHIFDRFYRTDPSRSRETGGAGLGLAIVKQLVAAHGATIRVESTVGAGTEFTIDWPATLPAG